MVNLLVYGVDLFYLLLCLQWRSIHKLLGGRRWDVDAALGRLFLEGVSTRRLRGIAKDLFGQEVSATAPLGK